MNKKIRIFSAVLSLLTAVLFASSVQAHDQNDEFHVAALIVKKTGITYMSAIEEARKAHPNGVVINYELESHDDEVFHEVKLVEVEEQRKYRIKVDAKTGKLLSESSESATSWFGRNRHLEIATYMKKAGFRIEDAIQALQVTNNMHIKEVEIEGKNGIRYAEVTALVDTGKQSWMVEIDSRQVIPFFKKHDR